MFWITLVSAMMILMGGSALAHALQILISQVEIHKRLRRYAGPREG
jgi:hypothetical protein